MSVFLIVGKSEPLFELDFDSSTRNTSNNTNSSTFGNHSHTHSLVSSSTAISGTSQNNLANSNMVNTNTNEGNKSEDIKKNMKSIPSPSVAANSVFSNIDEEAHLNQFILHSSLDMLEKNMWSTQNMNLRCIDRFQGQYVSAFLTAAGTVFLLLHQGKNEELIKNYFYEVYELYVRLILNPFFEIDSPIIDVEFGKRVRAIAKRYSMTA